VITTPKALFLVRCTACGWIDTVGGEPGRPAPTYAGMVADHREAHHLGVDDQGDAIPAGAYAIELVEFQPVPARPS
jgi:hypothetical protein